MSIEAPAPRSVRPEHLLIPEARGHQQRRHRQFALIVLVSALGIAAISSVWFAFLQGPRSASESGPATPAQLKVEGAACDAYWKSTAGLRSKLPGSEPATLPAMTVSDVRGSYTALLYMEPRGSWTCFLSSPSSVVGIMGGDGSFSAAPSTTSPVTLSSPALITSVHAKFQLIEGQALREVSSITITLSDGTVVRPTLKDGYVLAFWPGTTSAVSSAYQIGDATYQASGAPASPSQEFGDHAPSG